MEKLKLSVARRNVLGKKSRFLRREGVTPVHIFGHDIESLALQCDTAQLRKIIAQAGATRPISLEIDGDREPKSVFIREVQRDVFGKQLLHVDFYQVKKGEKITIDVPIVLVGEAPAMKGKGRMMSHGVTTLNVECLPENVPPQIEVDISQLMELDQPILVKDITFGPDIIVHADPELLVAKVIEIVVKEVVEEVVPAAAAEAAAAETPAEEGAEKAEKPGAEAKKER